jgi:hypothetical protein
LERKSMSPVELLRLIQFLQIIGRLIEEQLYEIALESFPVELSRMTGLFHLGSMTRTRVRSILREIAVCGLCSLEKAEITISKSNLNEWQNFSECMYSDIKNTDQRWSQLDSFLSKRHDLYGRFAETSRQGLRDKTFSLKENLRRNFPKPTVSTLLEWGCRLNRVQQDYLDEECIYPIDKRFRFQRRNAGIFRRTFIDLYIKERNRLELEAVSLPILAEKVCAWLRIRREDFRDFLEDFYDEHRSDVWLGSGVIRTYAYEGFVAKEQTVLDVLGRGPWFSREFYYKKTDLPQYILNNIPRRFIKIETELLKEVEGHHAHKT